MGWRLVSINSVNEPPGPRGLLPRGVLSPLIEQVFGRGNRKDRRIRAFPWALAALDWLELYTSGYVWQTTHTRCRRTDDAEWASRVGCGVWRCCYQLDAQCGGKARLPISLKLPSFYPEWGNHVREADLHKRSEPLLFCFAFTMQGAYNCFGVFVALHCWSLVIRTEIAQLFLIQPTAV